jgi:hypothetical protein
MLLLLSGSAALDKHSQDRDITKASKTNTTSRFNSNLLGLNFFLILIGRTILSFLSIFITVSISTPIITQQPLEHPDHRMRERMKIVSALKRNRKSALAAPVSDR